MSCACGKCWTKNSNHSRVRYLGSDRADNVWTLSSFLLESLPKAEEWGETLFVISMDVASACDSVRADFLGDVLLERGASAFSAAAVVRKKLGTPMSTVPGPHSMCPAEFGRGFEARRPRTPSGWNQLVAFLAGELLQLWSDRSPAVSWAPASSITEAEKRTQDIAHVFGRKKTALQF